MCGDKKNNPCNKSTTQTEFAPSAGARIHRLARRRVLNMLTPASRMIHVSLARRTRNVHRTLFFENDRQSHFPHQLHLLVNIGKARFVTLGLGFPRAHRLEGFPDEAAVLLARIALQGRVQST